MSAGDIGAYCRDVPSPSSVQEALSSDSLRIEVKRPANGSCLTADGTPAPDAGASIRLPILAPDPWWAPAPTNCRPVLVDVQAVRFAHTPRGGAAALTSTARRAVGSCAGASTVGEQTLSDSWSSFPPKVASDQLEGSSTMTLLSSAKERPVGAEPINPKFRPGIRVGTEPDAASRPLRFLRFPAVRARTGLSRTTIWRLERQGNFPRHRRISRNAVAWAEHEVADWIRSKLGATPQPVANDRPTR